MFLNFDEQEMLAEDLGNLKQINPAFVKALKRQTGRYSDGRYKQYHILSSRAGQNSQTDDRPMKTARAIASEFSESKSAIAMLVFDKKSGTQYGIIAERTPTTYANKTRLERTIGVFVDVDAIAGDVPVENKKTLRTAIFDKMKMSQSDGDVISREFSFDEGKIYGALNEINKFVKGPEKEITVRFFYEDTDRKVKKADRARAKSGMIPVKLSGKDKTDFENSARSALKARLDTFKTEKLKNQNKGISLDQVLDTIRTEGYLDKILIDGYIYDYYNDSFNFNNMKTGRHKDKTWESNRSYVTYRIDDDEETYRNIRNKFWNASSEIQDEFAGDKEAMKTEIERLKKRLKLPPRYIKVFFDFEGGMIVPAEIVVEFNI